MKRPRETGVIIVGTVLLTTLIFASPKWASQGRMGLVSFLKVPLGGSHWISYRTKAMLRYRSLVRENEELRATVDILTSQMMKLKEASIENDRLRGLLNFKASSSHTVIAAAVIGRDSGNWRRTILIDKGSNHGITEDKVILTHRGLVGRIIEVGPTIARAMLITDSDSRVAAIVQSNREEGLLYGTATQMCRLKFISPEAQIKAGDIVISSGFGGIYPQGLMLGEVVSTGREEGGLSLYAVVKPAADLSKLEEVLVWME